MNKPSDAATLRAALDATSTALAFAAQANLLLSSSVGAPKSAPAAATDLKAYEEAEATAAKFDELAARAGEAIDRAAMQFASDVPQGAIIVGPGRTLTKAIYADREPFPKGDAVVIDALNGLMWDAASLGEMTFAEATEACAKLRTGGFDDWRVPARFELESLLDLSRCDPAIDTNLFPDTKSTWYWSSTPAAYSPADCAWIVNFGNGNSYWNFHDDRYQVRAVRSVPRASQSSAIGASS